jgi:enoyl-CoA hydratase/carnithine racemase
MELCLSMRTVAPEEALALGLLDRTAADPRAAALELAAAVARLEPAAVARAKSVTRTASGVLDALEEERTGNLATWSGSVSGL